MAEQHPTHDQQEAAMATRDELQGKNKDELYEMASDRDVDGRSGMSKAELIDALADDGDGGTTTRGATVQESADQPRAAGDPDDKGYIGTVPEDDTDYTVAGQIAAQQEREAQAAEAQATRADNTSENTDGEG